MHTWLAASVRRGPAKFVMAIVTLILLHTSAAFAQPSEAGGEANLQVPDLSSVSFLGINGHSLLLVGLLFCVFGLLFGLAIYMQLKNLFQSRANCTSWHDAYGKRRQRLAAVG